MRSSPLPPFVQPVGPGIYAVDTGFHRDRFDAAYLVVEGGRAAFVDTGTAFAVPRLLQALQAVGLGPQDVDYVIPTHVHLDHAGGAGALMAELPAATLVVHPRGLRHMLDPQALWDGATAVYGPEQMARSYGRVVGVAADRARASSDGLVLPLAGRDLVFADTPGHARHHHCIWDAASRGWFTGDTFGLSYPEFDSPAGQWILPTSTPVQFEPEALQASIRRLLRADPACMYLTHFGRVGDVQRVGELLLSQVAALADIGRRLRDAPERHAALKQVLLETFTGWARAHGTRLSDAEIGELLAVDVELNAQGLASWLDKAG